LRFFPAAELLELSSSPENPFSIEADGLEFRQNQPPVP